MNVEKILLVNLVYNTTRKVLIGESKIMLAGNVIILPHS